jgi:hypothetical protein
MPAVKVINLNMLKQFRELSSKIRAGLHIRNFSRFDFITNHFVVNALVWFEFNQGEIPLKTIDLFSFENSKMIFKSTPFVTLHDDKMLVKYDVIFEIKTDVNFERFPLEDHRLSIVLANNFVTPNELYFDDTSSALSFSIAKNLFTSNWKPITTRCLPGYSSLHYDQFEPDKSMLSPKAIFSIDFAKNGISKILIIFIPLFAAIFLALFSFLMSFNNYAGKTNLCITAITALLGYRFVIQQMSPAVGYFTLTDKIFIFCLLFSFFIFVFQSLLIRHYMFLMAKRETSVLPETDRDFLMPKITERINGITYYLAIVICAIAVTIIVLG